MKRIFNDKIKRFFDVFLSILLITLLSPLFLLLTILIKTTSKGPVIYSSKRVKKDFALFDCYKFRTMYVDADKRLKTLLQQSQSLRKEWKEFQKLKNDPRVTWIGKILRKSSLDELPQLWNVLIGDMSLVGPRPYAIFGPKSGFKNELYSLYGKEIETILSIKPGLTGLWQVSGRNTLPLKKRLELDLTYIQMQNLKTDMVILAKTIPEIFSSKGAF